MTGHWDCSPTGGGPPATFSLPRVDAPRADGSRADGPKGGIPRVGEHTAAADERVNLAATTISVELGGLSVEVSADASLAQVSAAFERVLARVLAIPRRDGQVVAAGFTLGEAVVSTGPVHLDRADSGRPPLEGDPVDERRQQQ